MINKQIKIIIIGAVSIFALVLLYIFVLQPMFSETSESGGNEEIILLDGEELGTSNRIMITKQTTREEMKEVEISNPQGTYKVIHDTDYNIYYVEGAEYVLMNEESKALLFTNVGYLLSMARVTAEGVDEDSDEVLSNLASFGLAPENNPSWFKVTRTDGTSYKIIIGVKIPTTGGYYCMLEGRNAIYVIDTSIEQAILGTKYELMQALITTPVPQNDYFKIDNFKFYKDTELMFEVVQGKIPEGSNMLVNYQMTYPAQYKPSNTNFDTVLRTFVNFVGSEVVEIDVTEETLNKYIFINKSYHRIIFDYDGKEYDVLISPKVEDKENGDYHYVASMDFLCIVKIPAESLPFLEWDLLQFIEKQVFDQLIYDVESISIKADGKEDIFVHSDRDEEFTVTGNGKVLDTDKYKQFYKSILYIEILDHEIMPENTEPMCVLIIKMKDGTEFKYDFYFISTRRCFITINDSGEFYVNRERILKLIRDTQTALENGDIIAEAPE